MRILLSKLDFLLRFMTFYRQFNQDVTLLELLSGQGQCQNLNKQTLTSFLVTIMVLRSNDSTTGSLNKINKGRC